MFRALALLVLSLPVFAADPSWSRPFPPYKIAGNIYYVGTEDLACFLLATPGGHILINTGLASSAPLLRASVQQLGFRLEDVRILLNMQGHFDHVAALREIQKISGAKVFATEGDAPVLEDGGASDPFLSAAQYRFAPVKVDRLLKDGDVVELGGTKLTVILTPGHTRGSVSYATTVLDRGRSRSVLFANMNTVVMPLVNNAKYPAIVSDYERAFARQKQLSPEIWLAAHASQYGMAEKRRAGSFVDPDGYRRAVAKYEALFRETLAKERQ